MVATSNLTGSNPGPGVSSTPNTAASYASPSNPVTGVVYTFATLPSPAGAFTVLLTSDYGLVTNASGAWMTVNAGGSTSVTAPSRPPSVTDNTTLGYTTASVWQAGGTLYSPSVYCGADSAAWAPLNDSGIGTPVDVMGTTLTKFAGGTCAMLKGYVGAAVDVAVTIAGVYQIFTVNILATGELDNVSLGAVMAQADAGTNTKVLKIYDQTGNGNHATLANAAGIAVFAASATVTTATTLTINSGQTGTIAAAQWVFGNGIPPGITVASGAGPYTLSGAGAPANPAAIAVYFGVTTPPYIDWDPVMGRYLIQSPNEQTLGSTTNKRALQLPQAMSFTNANNIGVFAVGEGTCSAGVSQPCLCTVGDASVGTTNYYSLVGSGGTPCNLVGQIIGLQNGTNHIVPVSVNNQPCVVIASTASTPLTTITVNEQSATSNTAITSQALAGGFIFSYGGNALVAYGMMKLAGLAMFNAAPTVTQAQQMRYGAYARFNIYPQVTNQVALVGDSRLESFQVTPGFGIGALLPRYIGRNYDVINLAVHSQTTLTQIGDGLVPTVTGIAKSLQNFKKPGLNYAVILLGVNDFIVNSASVATVVGYLQILCAQIAAAGWVPVLIAEMATTSAAGGANTNLPLLNSAIVAGGSASFSGAQIVNLYGYVPVITPATGTYYSGGLHPTLATHQLMSAAVAQVIPH